MALSGESFAPLARENGQNAGPARRGAAPIQEAIRVLNLRVPSVVGARALSPQALLSAPGSAGIPNAAGVQIEQLLRRIFGQAGIPGLPAAPTGPGAMGVEGPALMPSAASAPAPHITPGIVPIQNGDRIPQAPQRPQLPEVPMIERGTLPPNFGMNRPSVGRRQS